jgi:hypothetical protein
VSWVRLCHELGWVLPEAPEVHESLTMWAGFLDYFETSRYHEVHGLWHLILIGYER